MITDKGRVYVALAKVRDRWDTFTPEQREEVAELVARLDRAMRAEQMCKRVDNLARPRPMVGRLSA